LVAPLSLSAIRAHYLSIDRCKEIGKVHIQDLTAEPPKRYCSLWTLQAACIRQAGADCEMSPGTYDGHVSIRFGVVRSRQDALENADDVIRYNAIVDELFKLARYFEDGDAAAENWRGQP
jgi:hypothetical protein